MRRLERWKGGGEVTWRRQVGDAVKGSNVELGAQSVYYEEKVDERV